MSAWLTIQEAAKRVKRSRTTIYAWIADGHLQKYTIERNGGETQGVMEGRLLDVDKQMRNRRGRPRKATRPANNPDIPESMK